MEDKSPVTGDKLPIFKPSLEVFGAGLAGGLLVVVVVVVVCVVVVTQLTINQFKLITRVVKNFNLLFLIIFLVKFFDNRVL
jgi:hypothetical protein